MIMNQGLKFMRSIYLIFKIIFLTYCSQTSEKNYDYLVDTYKPSKRFQLFYFLKASDCDICLSELPAINNFHKDNLDSETQVMLLTDSITTDITDYMKSNYIELNLIVNKSVVDKIPDSDTPLTLLFQLRKNKYELIYKSYKKKSQSSMVATEKILNSIVRNQD